MRLITSDQPYYEQMQQKSIARAALFDWSVTAEQTREVYQAAVPKTYEPEYE